MALEQVRGHAFLTQEPPDLGASGVGVAPAVERVIRRCLEKSPEERFQSARDLDPATAGARPKIELGRSSRDSHRKAAALAPARSPATAPVVRSCS